MPSLMRRTPLTPRRLVAGAMILLTAGATLGLRQSEPPVSATQPADAATAPAATAPAQPAATAPAAPVELDDRWLGTWQGQCEVLQPGGLVAGQFMMGLVIEPIEPEAATPDAPRYSWTIVYDNGQTQQTRPYILKVAVDDNGRPVPGHFLIDEQNGIVVDQFLVGETMQGHFIVASGERQTVLHARYALEEAEDGTPGLLVEISSYDGNFARSSGTAENGVVSRPMRSVQTGLLLKQGD